MIPGWAKLLAISAGVLALIALFIAAPWRPSQRELCAPLLENIEIVRGGFVARRVSDTYHYGTRGRRPRMNVSEGDFRGGLTLDELRSCLGEGWTELHVAAEAERLGDAWVFTKSGQPVVMYVQSRNESYSRVEMRIIIEPAS